MKKLFLFMFPILLLGGCSLTKNTDAGINTGDIEKISILEEQLSGMIDQFSGLQAENEKLKEYLSGAVALLKSLQTENELLQTNVDKYKSLIVEDKLNSSTGVATVGIQGNIQNTGSQNIVKEIGFIKQAYIDPNGNKKIEIDYVQQLGPEECSKFSADVKPVDIPGIFCLVNQNPKLRTFVISNNVQIVMQTLSHTANGNFNNNQIISFDYFKQKINDTIQYNYSNYLKAIPFRITIENNIIIKIEEQYIS